MPKKALVAVPDLMLQSRIAEAAKRLGVELVLAGTLDEVLTLGRREKPGLVILDLEAPKLDAECTLQRLRMDAELCAVPTVGLYGHVNKRLADRMVQAGCDRAIPRGQFVEKLEEILRPLAA